MRVPASAASNNADDPETAPTAVQLVPPLVEYHHVPFALSVAVRATPVTAPLSASVTLSSPPAGGFRLTSADTKVPTAPVGAPAFSSTASSAGVAAALSTGASLVPVIVTVSLWATVAPCASWML